MSTDEALSVFEQLTTNTTANIDAQIKTLQETKQAIEQALQVLLDAVNRQDDIVDQDGPL